MSRGMTLNFRPALGAVLALASLAIGGCSLFEVKRGEDEEASEAVDGEKAAVKAGTLEPGDSILNAAKTRMGTAIDGAFEKGDSSHFYYFANPGKLRDRVKIRLENKSTTYRPQFTVFDENKSRLGDAVDHTRGASLEKDFTIEPGKGIYVEVRPYNTEGAYELSVVPLKAFDAFEANDDQLNAATLKFGDTINASILDKDDPDWFHVTPATAEEITVALENLATTYRPQIYVYDTRKSQIMHKADSTKGAGLDFNVKVPPGQDFYIQVAPFNTSGAYRLSTRPALLAGEMASALEDGGSVSLYGIYFDTDKAFVKPESENTLKEVAELLKANPKLRLEVAGHTDDTGSKEHNQQLSQDRADAVVTALVGQYGIAEYRLVAKGYGDTKPISGNDSAAGKARNRRVQLRKL